MCGLLLLLLIFLPFVIKARLQRQYRIGQRAHLVARKVLQWQFPSCQWQRHA